MGICVCLITGAKAQAHRIDGRSPGLVEAGAPPFAILNQKSLGLNSPPTDLRLLPDGRKLVVGAQQLVLGDGVRWESFHQSPNDPLTAGLGVAVDRDGSIYTGTSSGFGRIEFIDNNFWQLTAAAPWPPGKLSDGTILRTAIVLDDEWFWHSGSGLTISWRPGQTARVIGRPDDVDHVFSLHGQKFLNDRTQGVLYRVTGTTMEAAVGLDFSSPNSTITPALPFNDDCLLVGTHGTGLSYSTVTSSFHFRPATL